MPESSAFSSLLLEWFASARRPLPWRESYHPYQVWLSEVMLQQTQMDRAVEYYRRFIGRFPDMGSLARASEEEVLRLWEGLGYYGRARNLLKAAKLMVERHDGTVPDDPAALAALPGIGTYTAGAVLSIAFGQDTPAVDANVERVLARVFNVDLSPRQPEGRRRFAELARSLIPPGQARDFNQALMEFGALVCLPRDPACGGCPLRGICAALGEGVVELRPAQPPVKPVTLIGMGTAVIVHEGLCFVQKRLPGGAWGGLWEFPGGHMEPGEQPEQTALREVWEETGFTVTSLGKLAVIKHSYTRFRVTMHAYLTALPAGLPPPEPVLTAATTYRWAPLSALADMAFPTAMRKLIETISRHPRLA